MLSSKTPTSEITPYITLSKPEQFDQNVLHIDVSHKGKPLCIQTPRVSFENGDLFQIFFEGKTPDKVSEFYSQFTQLDSFLSEKVSETLRKYLANITTRELYTPTIHPPKLLGCPPYIEVTLLEEVVPQNLDAFPSFGIGTFALALKHIVVTPTTAHPVWGIVQGLIHVPKINLPRLSIKEPVEEAGGEAPPQVKLEQITIELEPRQN